MDSKIRKLLVIKPLILLALSLAIAGFICWFIPYSLSSAISQIGNTNTEVSFPSYIMYAILVVFSINPIKLLISNLIRINKIETGSAPQCPTCSYPTVNRLAKKGKFQGQHFWGCMRFPKCNGKIHIG